MNNKRRQFIKTAAIGGVLAGTLPRVLAAAPPASKDAASGKKNKIKLLKDDIILFQGDSITDAHRKREEKEANLQMGMGLSYPAHASAELLCQHPGMNFKFYDRGVSGNKVYQLAERWDADCLDLKPTVLSILVGVNDFWHTLVNDYKGTIQTYRDDYKALLDRTKKTLPDVRLIIGQPYAVKGVKSVDDKWFPGFLDYQAAAKEIAGQYGAVFIPYQEVYDKAQQKAPGSYWTADGVHPNLAGARLMADAWLDAVTV